MIASSHLAAGGLIALAVGAALAAAPSERVPPPAACPLSVVQEKEAVLAFEELMPVVRHPRCMNCHGGVDATVEYAQGRHIGGKIEPQFKCTDCHGQLSDWFVPGPALHFTGKTSKQLCMQFKHQFPAGAHAFVEHIAFEPGLPPFIKTAFTGDRALDESSRDLSMENVGIPFRVEPPPVTHLDFVNQAAAWGSKIGQPAWRATPACGCEVRADGWLGTVETAFSRHDEVFGNFEEHATAAVWFDRDEDLSRGVPEEYWKSTAGKITWVMKAAGGRCRGGANGTTPIGLGGDDNPMAGLQFWPDSGGSIRYGPTIGPWQDRHYRAYSFDCGADPPLTMLIPTGASQWWHMNVEGDVLGPNDSVLQGSYRSEGPDGSVARWTWMLNRATKPNPGR